MKVSLLFSFVGIIFICVNSLAQETNAEGCRYSKAVGSDGQFNERHSSVIGTCRTDAHYCHAVVLCNNDSTILPVICKAKQNQGQWVCPDADSCYKESNQNSKYADYDKVQDFEKRVLDEVGKAPTPGGAR